MQDALALWRSLRPEEWRARSLCKGWSVKDVVEHQVWSEERDFQDIVRRVLAGESGARLGFDLVRTNDEDIARGRGRSVEDLLGAADEAVRRTGAALDSIGPDDWSRPAWNPIKPDTLAFYVKGRIWEWWTHNQDVRVPLKRPGGREPARVKPVLEVVRDGIDAVFIPERARGVHTSYSFDAGEVKFTIRIEDGKIAVEDGFDRTARVRVKADPAAFVLVGVRRMSQMRAVLTGKFRPSGNPIEGLKFLKYFREP